MSYAAVLAINSLTDYCSTLKSCNAVNNTELRMWPKLAKSEAAALVALVPASDLNLDPKLVPSPVTQDYLGFLSACRSWHYHCLGQVCVACVFRGWNMHIAVDD